jgi:hypothetical protein
MITTTTATLVAIDKLLSDTEEYREAAKICLTNAHTRKCNEFAHRAAEIAKVVVLSPAAEIVVAGVEPMDFYIEAIAAMKLAKYRYSQNSKCVEAFGNIGRAAVLHRGERGSTLLFLRAYDD